MSRFQPVDKDVLNYCLVGKDLMFIGNLGSFPEEFGFFPGGHCLTEPVVDFCREIHRFIDYSA